jgi:transcriptional regulator with XRE-family HTH domain
MGKTQEDFVQTSGRTHISMLERGVNAPTLTTIETLAAELKVHPLTIVALTYSGQPTEEGVSQLFELVRAEVKALGVAQFSLPNTRSRSMATEDLGARDDVRQR